MEALLTSIITKFGIQDYPRLLDSLGRLSREAAVGHCRNLARTDLYFLLRYAIGRADIEHPWLFERCREVQESPNGCLDLWAREHYKSTLITFGKTIQDILASHGEDPILPKEVTVGIFSHTRPIAKKFLRQIQQELETNRLLQEWFPEILWKEPKREAPVWSQDAGIIVKRKGNPKEATVEAWGLVDSQPTSAHFDILNYDDVVTRDSVTTPDMIAKTTEALELSYNLGAHGGVRRFIGTRYHFNDSYRTVIARGTATPRIHPATENGEVDGEPVFLDRETLALKRRDMGPYTFACQMMQNPKSDERQGFQREWVRHYAKHNDGSGMNTYLICDPASEKKKGSDYTAMGVIGLGADKNYYLLDGVYDRLNLKERTNTLIALHKRWRPLNVGYEKYGKDSDIEHIQHVQEEINYRFEITPLGGRLEKNDRIRRLVPVFSQGRFYLPEQMWKTNYEGIDEDLIRKFLEEEYDPFPVPVHDDFFDMLSRIMDADLFTSWPMEWADTKKDRYSKYGGRTKRSWKTI